jgi:raffinose/stachyose/melibiose transport system permease protein
MDAVALVAAVVVYVVPFVFVFLTAAKGPAEAGLFKFTWPSQFLLSQNVRDVMTFADSRMLRALWNSTLITAGSVTLTVVIAALVAVVLQRRADRLAAVVSALMLAGLIIPPAVVPTIFVLRWTALYRTLFGMILVNVALSVPFATLIMRAFMGTIPRELDEATVMDGASAWRLFSSVLLPLLQAAVVTVVVTSSVNIFNDFVGPLYFLPGAKNITAALTLFGFMNQFNTEWNLVFANVLVLTVLPFIVFIFFQKQLVSGLASGAIKG